MKILIVDSELLPARRMAGFFVNKGFICEHATDYNAASRKIDAYLYDIVILDTDINNGRGIQLISQITNKDAGTGIIVSTMRQSLPEKLECFELGADDYLVKPSAIEELYARVKALYRRRVFRGPNISGLMILPLIPSKKSSRTIIAKLSLRLKSISYWHTLWLTVTKCLTSWPLPNIYGATMPIKLIHLMPCMYT